MSEIESNPERRIALFQRKEIRRVIHNNEWWFVITDIVAALTDSSNPQGYFKDMRKRDPSLTDALKGGGKLPPPWPGVRHGGRTPDASMLEYAMNPPAVSLWDLLAAKLAAHPELFQKARDNCARWLREGHSGEARLREWDSLLAAAQEGKQGQERLLAMLTGNDEHSTRMRDFNVFAGILTTEERRLTRELNGYRH